MITEKQLNFITHLFEDTSMYEDFPKNNAKYPDTFVDARRLILGDMLKGTTKPQAIGIIDDLLNKNESSLKEIIGSNEAEEMSKMDAQDQAQELIK